MRKKTSSRTVKPAQKKKTAVAAKYITGAFGIRYPIGFQHKVTLPGELREVKWLIQEGVFESVAACKACSTRRLLTP